jgi:hypothetical protein
MRFPASQIASLRAPGALHLSFRMPWFSGAAFLACLATFPACAQNGVSTPPKPHPIILPEANRPPDANDQMEMRQAKQKKETFEAANELRHKQIDDESSKLLILAADLKSQMDKLGDKPPSERLMREAEVIEMLAHDVQAKMTMTVKGS